MAKAAHTIDEQRIAAVPEPGMTVEVRRRIWVVSDVSGSGTVTRPDGSPGDHLVSLTSIEDDGIGDELQVIWEIEPGTRSIERAGLPEPSGFDTPERLRAFLDAVRWGAVATSDRDYLQAPFRSGVVVEDYQLDPLIRSLQMPRVNLLIADDVGLGKTIEAGLVVQELLIRQRARTILVVCPASLQLKWQDEMRDKFGLEFRIVDTEYMRWLRRNQGLAANPWTSFPRLITSMDWAKHSIPRRSLEDVIPSIPQYPRTFDVMIVDEAHNVAPSGTGNYSLETLRTKLVRALAPHFEHRLFLTATPANGYLESFTSLLEILDDQRFARGVVPDRAQLQSVMVRRLKSEIVDKNGKKVFPERKLHRLEVNYSEDEKELHHTLQAYLQVRGKQPGGDGREALGLVGKLLKKRLFSCPAAFATTLEAHIRGLRETAAGARRPSIAEIRHIERGLRDDRDNDEEIEEEEAAGVVRASSSLADGQSAGDSLLNDLERLSKQLGGRSDSKSRALIAWLDEHIKPGGHWTDERVIIFTEYLTTLRWLQGVLTSNRYGEKKRLLCMYGGMESKTREEIKAAFQADPAISEVRILLATDTASEGIDLQKYCSKLIHFEIPWNPNVMEQRNGRIDRHGQKKDTVHIWHPVGGSLSAIEDDANPGNLEGDLEFLYRVARKVESIREDLGKVGPVLEEQVEQAMLGYRRTLDTAKSETEAKQARGMITFERQLREQIKRHRERLDETRAELGLTPERIHDTVRIALQLEGQPQMIPASLPGAPAGRVFRMPLLHGGWEQCLAGLADPYTRQPRPVTFDPEVARGRDDVVLVHLEHRLVRLALQKLRAEVWTADDVKRMHRFSCRLTSAGYDSPVVVAWSRLVVTGARGHRLHEEVFASALDISGSRPVRLNASQTEELLQIVTTEPASKHHEELMQSKWQGIHESVMAAIDARANERHKHVLGLIERRRKREREAIATALGDLSKSITESLAKEIQIELFPDERRQLTADRDSLRERLARIPEELHAEQALIDRRFSDPVPRPFPVAVEFLIPPQWRS